MTTITQLPMGLFAQPRASARHSGFPRSRGNVRRTKAADKVREVVKLIRYLEVVRDAPSYREVPVAVIPYFQEHER